MSDEYMQVVFCPTWVWGCTPLLGMGLSLHRRPFTTPKQKVNGWKLTIVKFQPLTSSHVLSLYQWQTKKKKKTEDKRNNYTAWGDVFLEWKTCIEKQETKFTGRPNRQPESQGSQKKKKNTNMQEGIACKTGLLHMASFFCGLDLWNILSVLMI